jgi:hypothetical protein
MLLKAIKKQPELTQTLLSSARQCGATETAQSYLVHLGRDGFDQAARAIPPQTWEWRIPGYRIKVKQGWGKDGLTYHVELTGPDNKTRAFFQHAEVNQKGTKIPVAHIPMNLAGGSQGYADLSLRVDGTGLNEFEIKHTDPQGQIKILKLKPTPCNVDLTGSRLLRLNVGNAHDARYWAEKHLAQTARAQHGQLMPGLLDLLTQIQPGASGQYLNHGSTALEALTRPLNLLKAAGVDLTPLQHIKNRTQAKNWLFHELQNAVSQGKIPAQALVNRYRINYGIPALAALMPEPARKTPARPERVEQWVGAKTPQGTSLQAPVLSTNQGRVFYLKGKNTSYALPGTNLRQASEAARQLIRSGRANDFSTLPSHSPQHIRWVGAKTPDGISVQGQLVFWRNESGQVQYALKGTNHRLYPLLNAQGQAPSNALEATRRAQDLIRHGAATHLYALADAQPARPKPQKGIEQLHTKVDLRRVQEVVHQQGWAVTQLPNGQLFIADLGVKTGNLAQVLRALAQILNVPLNRLRHTAQTHRLLGQDRKGYIIEGRVFQTRLTT